MDHRPPAPARDAAAAGWIADRLIEDFGAVCRTIPSGFSAYARVLHPANAGSPESMRWSEVARLNGRTMHALAQFHRIDTPAGGRGGDRGDGGDGGDGTDVQAPELGDLVEEQLRPLCAILRRHTLPSQQCWYAIWEGWGDLNSDWGDVEGGWTEVGGAAAFAFATNDATSPMPRPAPKEWQLDLRAATFDLPDRRYYLFTGGLDDATRFGHWATRDWFIPRSPNLFWPDDQRWCVASEIDFDSTLVAGSAELIADIVHSEDLEAWPVEPRDSLAYDGDTINLP